MTVSIKEIIDHRNDDFTHKYVMCRSNEDEPMLTGHVIRYEHCGATALPVIKDYDGKEWVVMGIVMEHTNERMRFFERLEPKEQWRILENEIYRRERDRDWLGEALNSGDGTYKP